jgi:hypothetical protein
MHAWVYLVIDLNRYNMGWRDDICMLSSVGSYGYTSGDDFSNNGDVVLVAGWKY